MIFVVYGVCIMLVFLIDFVEMMREAAKVDMSAGQVVILTLLRLPAFAELILPFAVLIGSIGAFLMLSRCSELVIVRAAGLSVWQFLTPAMLVGLLIGVFSVTVYNPLAARAQARGGPDVRQYIRRQGHRQDKTDTSTWIRQDGPDGQSIFYAPSRRKPRHEAGRVDAVAI